MEMIQQVQRSNPPAWVKTVASLLPLWLFSLTITVEGFPRPPISLEVAFAAFGASILASVALLWKRWAPIELVLYSFIPFFLLLAFDEISTTYKTPFIFTSALILSIGVIGYQSNRLSLAQKWLALIAIAILTLFVASHAADRFWQMTSALGFGMCFPDYTGCAPLTGTETPWWQLFFSL